MLDDALIKRLLLRTAAREAQAFDELYRATAPLLMGVALRITGRRELAEEVLHDAYVKVWNSARTFDPLATQPVAWMVAIARNRAIDLMQSADQSRVQSVDQWFDDDAEGALDRLFDWSGQVGQDEAEDARRASRWLRECLGRLGASERQALVLAYEHGLSHSELAAHLARPLGTVKSWVRRGLDNLRGCVERCMTSGSEAS